ncbi:MAG TPA: MBL fold metallo-hydrolase [Planctomycetota bacterium]|nr:MBL fold metallo-hydrolase [Planctomycetota bacterium]
MQLRFFGATGGTTGTCHRITVGGRHVHFDCGLFQGPRAEARRRNERFGFDPSEVHAVVQSHAHIDHSGKLPMLVREDFKGPIHATHGTRDLCGILLRDCAHILLKDAESLNRKRIAKSVRSRRKHERGWRDGDRPRPLGPGNFPTAEIEPLYLDEDVEDTLPLFVAHDYGAWFEVAPGFRARFHDAGHILGSAWIESELEEDGRRLRLVFSGDYGRPQPILRDPEPLAAADVVVCESTYGDRLHEPEVETLRGLDEALTRLERRGHGRLLIPSFAVGRTQNLLYLLAQLFERRGSSPVSVVVDSPLATSATRIVASHPEYFDAEARAAFERFGAGSPMRLEFTESVDASIALNHDRRPLVLLSASGMMESGRVLHHLAWNVGRDDCEILVVGYQASGTLGRRILEGAPEVNILGERYAVRARVTPLLGFSAHADRDELLATLGPLARTTARLFLVHGEDEQRAPLARRLRELGFRDVFEPRDERAWDLDDLARAP